jgi:hypothetical protein
MTLRVVTRGNTVFLSFTFYDEDGAVAVCTSAEVQLTYPGNRAFETETITLTNASNVWSGSWDSSHARAGWVEYHAHAVAAAGEYAQDGRFRLTANRANLDHDTLQPSGTLSDYGLIQ